MTLKASPLTDEMRDKLSAWSGRCHVCGEDVQHCTCPGGFKECRCYRIGDIEDATDCPVHGQRKESDV